MTFFDKPVFFIGCCAVVERGTLPALTFVGLGVRAFAGAFAKRIPTVSAAAILMVGLYTIAVRANISLQHASGHHHAETPDSLLHQVNLIDEKTLPCCTTPSIPAEGARQ